jgi:hypothetical protein
MVKKVISSQLLQSTLREVSSINKINPIILNRRSPRSLTDEKLSYEKLMSLFGAAHLDFQNARPHIFQGCTSQFSLAIIA